MRNLVLNTAATERSVRVDDLKAHLRIDHTDQDVMLEGLIEAATLHVESVQNRSLLSTTWDLYLDAWPQGRDILLPRAPLQSVVSVVHIDDEGTETTMPSSGYFVDLYSSPGRIVLSDAGQWPTRDLRPAAGIRIRFVAGYGDSPEAVPADKRHLVKLLAAHWFDNPEPEIVGSISSSLPFALESMLHHDRLVLNV